MAQTLSVSEFETAVNAILAEYKDAIDADVAYVTKQVAKSTAENVRKNAPVRTGAYKKSIAVRPIEKRDDRAKSVVYAKDPHYRLTHLLEFGHAKVNGGRTNAFPHWSQAERQAIREYEDKLREAIK